MRELATKPRRDGFGVRRPAQVQRGKQLPAARQRGFDPLPADPQVGVPPQPVRIDPAPFLLRHDLRALRHQIERGDGHHEAEAGKRVGIAHERAFELKAIGFIVQEVLFNSQSASRTPRRCARWWVHH